MFSGSRNTIETHSKTSNINYHVTLWLGLIDHLFLSDKKLFNVFFLKNVYIVQITFITNRNRYGPYGKRAKDNACKLVYNGGNTLLFIAGRKGSLVDMMSLYFDYCKNILYNNVRNQQKKIIMQ